jgi:hypothetical protein
MMNCGTIVQHRHEVLHVELSGIKKRVEFIPALVLHINNIIEHTT